MTKVTPEAEFKFRGRVNQELVNQYKSSTMSTSHTDDAQAGVPLDTEFWSRVAASQAADDAEEAFDAEIPRQDQ